MKHTKLVLLLAVLLCGTVMALDPPSKVEQYQTAGDTRLYFLFNTYYGWPLSVFDHWEIVISDQRLGNHPPYIGALTTLSDQNYVDPEIRLPRSVKLQEGVTYYARAFVWNDTGGVFDQTPEFTFVIGAAVPATYSATLPWVAADVFDWNTSVVVTNPTMAAADIEFEFHSMSGGYTQAWNASIPPWSTISFYLSNYPAINGYCGWMTIKSTSKAAYSQMTVYYGTPAFAVSDSGVLE